MSAKSIFIIVLTVLLTVILMNNNEEMSFWIFGEAKVPKLGVLAGVFFAGWLIGFLMGRPKSTPKNVDEEYLEAEEIRPKNTLLSQEDQDYIS
jgi:uncharacterized integral membrane protein